jgi:hypothetical protein
MACCTHAKQRTWDRVVASIGLTDLSLSCAARARVPKSRGRQVAAYTAGRQHAICNLHDAATLVFGRGASAPDRKPGRDSCSGKLGAGRELGRLLGETRAGQRQAIYARTMKPFAL